MKRTALIVLGLLLLTFIVGLVPAALVWESAGRNTEPKAMKWVLAVYIVFLALVHILFFVAVKMGAFRNVEAAKYRLLEIEEKDYYTPAGQAEGEKKEVEHDTTERQHQ